MGSAEPQPVTMRAFVIVALAASVYGEAKPYTVGQVLAGATSGGVITSTTYHGGLKVAGFPHAAVVPALGYATPVVYGKWEAEPEPYTVGQVFGWSHCWWHYHIHHLCWRTEGAWTASRPPLPSCLRQERSRAPVLPVPQPWSFRHNQPRPRGGRHPRRAHPLLQRRPLHQLCRSSRSLLGKKTFLKLSDFDGGFQINWTLKKKKKKKKKKS